MEPLLMREGRYWLGSSRSGERRRGRGSSLERGIGRKCIGVVKRVRILPRLEGKTHTCVRRSV